MADCQNCQILKKELENLQRQLEEIKDKHIRCLAEMENMRNKYKRDTGKYYKPEK